MDFALSLGGRWGDAAKLLKNARYGKHLVNIAKVVGPVAAKARLTKLKPDQYVAIAGFVKDLVSSEGGVGMKTDAHEPQVSTFSLPIGVGLEVGLFYAFGYCRVLHYSDTSGIAWER